MMENVLERSTISCQKLYTPFTRPMVLLFKASCGIVFTTHFGRKTSMKTQTILKTYKALLVFFAAVLILSCNQNPGDDFVKLDAPLKEVLPKITVIVPGEQDKDGKALEIIVGETFKGKAEYLISEGETHQLDYSVLNQHAVEGNRYIYTVVSYNLGGSGTFYYLTAIDKSTLKSVSEVLLGDRVQITSLELSMPRSDTVKITYKDREQGTAFTENPDKDVSKHFHIEQSKLTQVLVEKLE